MAITQTFACGGKGCRARKTVPNGEAHHAAGWLLADVAVIGNGQPAKTVTLCPRCGANAFPELRGEIALQVPDRQAAALGGRVERPPLKRPGRRPQKSSRR